MAYLKAHNTRLIPIMVNSYLLIDFMTNFFVCSFVYDLTIINHYHSGIVRIKDKLLESKCKQTSQRAQWADSHLQCSVSGILKSI